MNYLNQLRKDMLSNDKYKIADEVEDRILFQRYYVASKDVWISLKDIIRYLGTEDDIQTIINHLKMWVEPNDKRFIYVACIMSHHEIYKNKDRQKMLSFVVHDTTTGCSVICGGIVFQDGKISFHT